MTCQSRNFFDQKQLLKCVNVVLFSIWLEFCLINAQHPTNNEKSSFLAAAVNAETITGATNDKQTSQLVTSKIVDGNPDQRKEKEEHIKLEFFWVKRPFLQMKHDDQASKQSRVVSKRKRWAGTFAKLKKV
jgi:hypothetical protein